MRAGVPARLPRPTPSRTGPRTGPLGFSSAPSLMTHVLDSAEIGDPVGHGDVPSRSRSCTVWRIGLGQKVFTEILTMVCAINER